MFHWSLKDSLTSFKDRLFNESRDAALTRRGSSLLFMIVTTTFALLFTCGLAYSVTVKLTIQKQSTEIALSRLLETLRSTYPRAKSELQSGADEDELIRDLTPPRTSPSIGERLSPFLIDIETIQVVVAGDLSTVIGSAITEKLRKHDYIERETGVSHYPARISLVRTEDEWWISAAVPVPETGRMFCLARDTTEMMAQALRLQQQLVGLLILSYAFFLALLVMVMKIIVNPIRTLTEAAGHYAKGDFDYRVEVIQTMAEIQVLAKAFNRMGRELKVQRDHLRSNSRELEIANRVRGGAMEKLSRKNRELSAMIETSMLANQLKMPDQIIELTAKRLRDDLHLSYAVLYVPSESGGMVPRRMPGLPLPVGKTIPKRVANALHRCHSTRSPQRLAAAKPSSDADRSSSSIDNGAGYFGERLFLPLEIESDRVGVLELIAPPEREIDRETEDFCRHFVNHMGVILKNKALFQESSQRTDELEKINQVSRAISGKLDMESLLEDVVGYTQKTMEARCAFIGVLENGRLVIRHITPGAQGVDRWLEDVTDDELMQELIQIGHPILANDLNKDNRVPLDGFIRRNGFRSFIGSPIEHENEVIGVLCGFSHEPGEFTDSDGHFLGLLASQVSIALANATMYEQIGAQARRRQDQLNVAQKLQRDRMPSFFKQDIASFHSELKPAYELAGDFCDVFSLGRNTIAVVTGDVANKGVAASLMTFSLLSMFRNVAKTHKPPCEIMDAINTSLITQIKEDGWFATAFYARFNTSNGVFTYSSAGHELPIWYHADTGEVEMLETTGYPLGIFDSDRFRYETREIQMRQGDRIVFYTDGVTDAMDANGNRFGHEALRALVSELGELGANKLTSAVIDKVEEFTGGKEQRDDIIVAVLEYQSDPWIYKTINYAESNSFVNEILDALKSYKLDKHTTYGIRLAVDEALANAWRHGLARRDYLPFNVSYLISEECFKFRIKDPGGGFDHEALPDPTVPENLFKTSGRGVFLIRQMMDEVEFNEAGNEITITKVFPPPMEPEESSRDRIKLDSSIRLMGHEESLERAKAATIIKAPETGSFARSETLPSSTPDNPEDDSSKDES